MAKSATGRNDISRQIQRLSAERTELFARGSAGRVLTEAERRRIREIGDELDVCFRERRTQRAAHSPH